MPEAHQEVFEVIVPLNVKYGIHSRPAESIAKFVHHSSCRVSLTYRGVVADAGSILELLRLAISGEEGDITITVHGCDATRIGAVLARYLTGLDERLVSNE